MTRLSLAKDNIRVLLLEGIHDNALGDLGASGYPSVTRLKTALAEDELIERLDGVHMLGIRSRTRVTSKVLEATDRLIAIGCFCIGTDQVDLDAARARGVPVFNAPFSNTRSVAELVIGEIIMLMRGILPKSEAAHRGRMDQVGRQQLGGPRQDAGHRRLRQYRIAAQRPGRGAGHARHLPRRDTAPAARPRRGGGHARRPSRRGRHRLAPRARHGRDTRHDRRAGAGDDAARAFLVNASRGKVVDIEALAAALADGRLLGAAIDVFPREPAGNGEELVSPLRGLSNVILTPHIGGSTAEAQARIGNEVARKLVEYSDIGTTAGAVNFPNVQLPARPAGTRFMHVHRNTPGILARVVDVFVRRGINIGAQFLQTDEAIGYVVVDVDNGADETREILSELRDIDGTIRCRFLYERH